MIAIRHTSISDAEQMLGIYAPYVLENSVSFEIELPTLHDFQERIKNYTSKFPWLVAEENDRILGYAYASTYREREAYKFNVEVSVYLAPDAQKKGIAKQLYEKLFGLLNEQKIHQAFAVITLPNEKSIHFHKKMGFESFATYEEVGYKFNQWHDVHWMKKYL
ncbi:MAG: N-acetyltransferase family protein [Flavobacteriales bacterium]